MYCIVYLFHQDDVRLALAASFPGLDALVNIKTLAFITEICLQGTIFPALLCWLYYGLT